MKAKRAPVRRGFGLLGPKRTPHILRRPWVGRIVIELILQIHSFRMGTRASY